VLLIQLTQPRSTERVDSQTFHGGSSCRRSVALQGTEAARMRSSAIFRQRQKRFGKDSEQRRKPFASLLPICAFCSDFYGRSCWITVSDAADHPWDEFAVPTSSCRSCWSPPQWSDSLIGSCFQRYDSVNPKAIAQCEQDMKADCEANRRIPLQTLAI